MFNKIIQCVQSAILIQFPVQSQSNENTQVIDLYHTRRTSNTAK
jgi:hypothetical protein